MLGCSRGLQPNIETRVMFRQKESTKICAFFVSDGGGDFTVHKNLYQFMVFMKRKGGSGCYEAAALENCICFRKTCFEAYFERLCFVKNVRL